MGNPAKMDDERGYPYSGNLHIKHDLKVWAHRGPPVDQNSEAAASGTRLARDCSSSAASGQDFYNAGLTQEIIN